MWRVIDTSPSDKKKKMNKLMVLLLSLPLSLAAMAVTPPDTTLYNESYRPQYHFTAAIGGYATRADW